MRYVLFITVSVIVGIACIIAFFTLIQANREERNFTNDLQYRTTILSESLKKSIVLPQGPANTSTVQQVIDQTVDSEQLVGIELYDQGEFLIARSKNIPENISGLTMAARVTENNAPEGEFIRSGPNTVYIFASPLQANDRVIGALVVIQSASYIQLAIAHIWQDNLLRMILQLSIISIALYALVRFVFYQPIAMLTESIRAMRRGESIPYESMRFGSFLSPLANEIHKISSNLRDARRAASDEARMRLEKLDSPWTIERLKEFMLAYLKNRPIYVLSNREPYIHTDSKNEITWSIPAGGVVTALDAVLAATGGTWIAHGSGSADKQVVDEDDKIAVPPDEPKYTLKRVWISDEELKGYYAGFSNEALWPLSHMAHVRPIFRADDWHEYRKVNGLFAKTLLKEIKNVERPIILIQDYHLALLPDLIKKSRPDVQIAIFWHIPWPNAAQFSICPWRSEILAGLLGADLIGFHTQQYCNNFIETVATELESRIDYEDFSISYRKHISYIKPFPISVAFTGTGEMQTQTDRAPLEALSIHSKYVGIGVDRLDYTKGIMERFKGIEFFLDTHPEFIGQFTFLQIAAPTRESVEKYREYADQVTSEAQRINERFGTHAWKPIVLERKKYPHSQLHVLYQLADVCLVTSLHDGMNLVAKEYVAARNDEKGVLILSKFTGASRDLKSAILINPYSAEEVAEAIMQAVTMVPAEQYRRMKAMRTIVRDYNIYRWAAELIKTLARID
jgi:alpha,alpha-trehalose-phosphate synthase [UDP-forming]